MQQNVSNKGNAKSFTDQGTPTLAKKHREGHLEK